MDESSRTWYFRDMEVKEKSTTNITKKLLMEWGIQFWDQLENFKVDASELNVAEKLSKISTENLEICWLLVTSAR